LPLFETNPGLSGYRMRDSGRGQGGVLLSEQGQCRRARRSEHRKNPCLYVVLLLVVLLVASGQSDGKTTGSDRIRVAAIDWGQAQTLTAMGIAPAAAAQIESYNVWVGAPKLPASVRDVGLRAQPN